MNTVILDIDDPRYCGSDNAIAFPVLISDRSKYQEGSQIRIEMPKINCVVIAKIDFIEEEDVFDIFDTRPIPPEFMGQTRCLMIGTMIEKVI